MKILLIGCGKMGGAMLSAWLSRGIVKNAVVVDHAVQEIRRQFSDHIYQMEVFPGVQNLPVQIDVDLIVLAVKPQQMTEVLADLAPRMKPEFSVMTIAAGLRRSYYERYLPHNPIIRVMPNTPAMVGKGMTVGVRPQNLSDDTRMQIEKLLKTNGEFFWLDSEEKLEAAMAISGSGPAYYFYLTEMLAKAGVVHGLSNDEAQQLARQTLIGAGALAGSDAETTLTELRKNVTSKGGVTETTLKVWDSMDSFFNLIRAGIDANLHRSKELSDT